MSATPSATPETRYEARYEPVLAINAQARLRTATKLTCNCAVAFGAEPNANTCPVCLGLPGALPALNARAVEVGVRAALALGCTVHPVSEFARDHRLTPDLPKGYRLTQTERPLATRGSVQIGETPEGGPILVAVTRVHLEEDGGRMVHNRFPEMSGLDDNTAGMPLLAIASAPDLRSTAEARAYVRALHRLLRLAGASDADLEDGSLWVTATVSVRARGETAVPAGSTVANLRSTDQFTSALDAEFARQCALLDAKNTVEPRLMLWDPDRAELRPARAQPGDRPHLLLADPDLPPLVLTGDWIDAQCDELPERPPARRARLKRELDLDDRALDVLTDDVDLAEYYESVARLHGDARAAAEWTLTEVVPLLRSERVDAAMFALRVRPADLARVLDMVRGGELTRDGARQVFAVMARTGEPAARVADREGARLTQIAEP